MSKSTWTGAVNSDWNDPDNWSPAGVPGAGSEVTIATGDAVASASIGTVDSITDSSDLRFRSAGTNTVAAFLNNSGELRVDRKGGAGGTILNIGGKLTNSGSLRVGNAKLSASDEVKAAALDNTGGEIRLLGSSANQALLDVTGSAGFGSAAVLSGSVYLTGDSAIEFASGEITSLAANAQLHLNGNDAFVEDSKATGSNSALAGLASIGAGAIFGIHNKAAVSTSGSLTNDGTIRLDFVGDDGGSSLTVGGTLTNSGSLSIGNTTLSASDRVAAASLDNAGFIQLTGSSANQALLDVAGSAGFGTAGVLSGSLQLSGDSAIEFKGGQITSLAANAQLHLTGNDAFIEDSTALGSNSALTGLSSIGAGATFELENKAAVSTTGALANDGNIELSPSFASYAGSSLTVAGALTNSGFLGVDWYYGPGGSTLSIGGALTNTGTLRVGSPGGPSAPSKVTAASLDNAGTIQLGADTLLDVTAGSAGFGTAGVLSGNVFLEGDSEISAIEFASGQISTIAASSALTLLGNDAFVEDSTALGSNSALTGLTDIAGSLSLENNSGSSTGTSVSTTGSVTNSGFLGLDYYYGGGGSTLSIGGTLTNTGMLEIGSSGFFFSSSVVTAKSLVNSGTVDLTGVGTNLAALDVSGATTNTGSISIASDTEELAGAVGGKGSFSLSTANLLFDSSVSAGQTISETGADALTLKQAQSFAATISGFGTGDTIDATNFVKSATTFKFVENSAGTGGTLTLTDGSLTANIQMTGVYTKSDFALAPDSGTGTLVKFV